MASWEGSEAEVAKLLGRWAGLGCQVSRCTKYRIPGRLVNDPLVLGSAVWDTNLELK
jgi:hypothetical protein